MAEISFLANLLNPNTQSLTIFAKKSSEYHDISKNLVLDRVIEQKIMKEIIKKR